MKVSAALMGGLAGASVLTVVHEATRRIVPNAPRMDLMGMQALAKALHTLGLPVPDRSKLFPYTLAGDVVGNGLYYSLAGVSTHKNVILKSTVLGLSAGIGAISVPEKIGLNEKFSNRNNKMALITLALYTMGGFTAGLAMKWLQKKASKKKKLQLVM